MVRKVDGPPGRGPQNSAGQPERRIRFSWPITKQTRIMRVLNAQANQLIAETRTGSPAAVNGANESTLIQAAGGQDETSGRPRRGRHAAPPGSVHGGGQTEVKPGPPWNPVERPSTEARQQRWQAKVESLNPLDRPTTALPQTLTEEAARNLDDALATLEAVSPQQEQTTRRVLTFVATSPIPVSWEEIITEINPDGGNTDQAQITETLQLALDSLRVTDENRPKVVNHMLAHYKNGADHFGEIKHYIEKDMVDREIKYFYAGEQAQNILDRLDPNRMDSTRDILT